MATGKLVSLITGSFSISNSLRGSIINACEQSSEIWSARLRCVTRECQSRQPKTFCRLTSQSLEAQVANSEKTQAREEGSAPSKFTTDFTGKARKGEIDPVLSRSRNSIRYILARRRKNNPIAVGALGETAVVEGLALKIVQGEVPDNLKGVELYGLDMDC